MSESRIELHLTFEDEDADKTMDVLKDVGAEKIERVRQAGLTGVEIVVVSILAAQALVNLAIKLVALWKCGVVIDARGSKVLTRKDCDLPRGSVVIINKKGEKTTINKTEGFNLDSLIKKALSMES